MQAVEVSRPEHLLLHNQRHDARLQLLHERVARKQLIDVPLALLQAEPLLPAGKVVGVLRLVAVRAAVALHGAHLTDGRQT